MTVDGKGELGGYANYANRRVANAIVVDVMRTVQEAGMGAGDGLDTAMILVAAVDIPAGREVRWDYMISRRADHSERRCYRRVKQ